jgi:hypothetical protein
MEIVYMYYRSTINFTNITCNIYNCNVASTFSHEMARKQLRSDQHEIISSQSLSPGCLKHFIPYHEWHTFITCIMPTLHTYYIQRWHQAKRRIHTQGNDHSKSRLVLILEPTMEWPFHQIAWTCSCSKNNITTSWNCLVPVPRLLPLVVPLATHSGTLALIWGGGELAETISGCNIATRRASHVTHLTPSVILAYYNATNYQQQ